MWAVQGDLSSSVPPAVLQAVVDNGADVNVPDDRGRDRPVRPVRYIDGVLDTDNGRDCLEVLFAARVDRNARNTEGKTLWASSTPATLR